MGGGGEQGPGGYGGGEAAGTGRERQALVGTGEMRRAGMAGAASRPSREVIWGTGSLSRGR